MDAPLGAGSRLGPYEILSRLGAGGMGEVYRARDTRLERAVAIKILPTAASADSRRLERFRQEARAVSRLSHPHICTLHDVGEQDGTFFLVMEHLAGRTLANRLEEGPLPLPELLRHGIQIAEALFAAHREGVIHRDLKPSNVMLTREGVKLLDFGLARLKASEQGPAAETVSALTEEGVVLGTLPYMAPEQLEGKPADARTDVFALGLVLHEMAAGRRPFEGSSRASLIAAILTAEPPRLSERQPLTPPALEWAVRRCLAKNPDERWQSAADVAAQLRWILEGGSQAGLAPSLARDRRSRERLGWYAAATLAGVALALAIIVARGVASQKPPLRFQRLTFRAGTILDARFAADGQTVVYSANWQGEGLDMFLSRLGSPESRPLGIENGRIVSISRGSEMAFLFVQTLAPSGAGTLARTSLAGGAPRRLIEAVRSADWLPDGSDLAVARQVGPKDVVEFPVGHKVHEGPMIRSLRVSPDGSRVAFFQGAFGLAGDLHVVDRSGKLLAVSKGWIGNVALAWAPGGDEVWFGATRGEDAPALHALSLSGKERVLANAPGLLVLRDVRDDGRALVETANVRIGLACQPPGETDERELGWLDSSWIEDVSADGRLALVYEGASGGVPGKGGVYARALDGSPAVRLGDGRAETLSPDGAWALVVSPPSAEGDWFLLPTGPGSPRKLDRGPVRTLVESDWLADGKRIVLTGREDDGRDRLYVLDAETGALRRLTEQAVGLPENAATQDGRSVVLLAEGKTLVYPLDGGEARPIPHLTPDDSVLQVSPDGRFAYVRRPGLAPAEIQRLEIATGTRTPWKTLSPRDRVGLVGVQPVILQADGRSYCYSYTRVLSDLYLVHGLR